LLFLNLEIFFHQPEMVVDLELILATVA
jgi:hypothetical protein